MINSSSKVTLFCILLKRSNFGEAYKWPHLEIINNGLTINHIIDYDIEKSYMYKPSDKDENFDADQKAGLTYKLGASLAIYISENVDLLSSIFLSIK